MFIESISRLVEKEHRMSDNVRSDEKIEIKAIRKTRKDDPAVACRN